MAEKPEMLDFSEGDLFHAFERYSWNADFSHIDRLATILTRGLVAPAADDTGTVTQECPIQVSGTDYEYTNLVFLHQYTAGSSMYLMSFSAQRIIVLVDTSLVVLQPQDMGAMWPVLCQDEVYVQESVSPTYFRGLILHTSIIDSVIVEFTSRLSELGLQIYDENGMLRWHP